MIVRIIIDGYNLLHAWKEIAPKKVRYSEDARQELIKVLTWYSDVSISPVTVIFDGRAEGNHPENDKTAPKGLEILYTEVRQAQNWNSPWTVSGGFRMERTGSKVFRWSGHGPYLRMRSV